MKQKVETFLETELITWTEKQAKKEGMIKGGKPNRSALIRKAVLEYKEKVEKDG